MIYPVVSIPEGSICHATNEDKMENGTMWGKILLENDYCSQMIYNNS